MKPNLKRMYDQPNKHEFMVNPDKTMTHLRTGEKVACFEVTGKTKNGKRFSQLFTADEPGFMSMQMINIYEGTRWARLVNGHRLKLSFTRN